MAERVTLIGLDFGTTTSSAVIADAEVTRSAGTGRTEFSDLSVRFRSDLRFTPIARNGQLDIPPLESFVDDWLAAGRVDPAQIFGGGALLTGLTARRDNAAALIAMVRWRLGDALIATADDPRLESWLAFMGSCTALSRANPDRPVLNFDIGGGTTNVAMGLNGEVLDTACLFIGARHIQVEPGSYRIVALSDFARAILDTLGFHRESGDDLRPDELDSFLKLQVAILESAAGATHADVPPTIIALLTQSPFRRSSFRKTDPLITFTGGVGELIYARAAGRPWPATTHFGDLGIDLAQRIVASPILSPHIRSHRPASAGRATALGLMRHCTDVSGSTLFLPHPDILPLSDIPVFGTIKSESAGDQILALLDLVRHSTRGGCLIIELTSPSAADVREIGERLSAILDSLHFTADQLLVLLVRENIGKALGNFVTNWQQRPLNLIVIDEVPPRDAQYLRLGRPHRGNVPVSFYGLNDV